MEMSEYLFCGYIDVKVPSKSRKFGPWKWDGHFALLECFLRRGWRPTLMVRLPASEEGFQQCEMAFTQAWKKQWCSIRLSSENSVEVGLGNSKSNLSNSFTVPINASICRSESRTRSYAFGIFPPESKYRRAVLFLAGNSETESQKWMSQIRTLLKPNLMSVANDEFFVSLIDSKSSRNAGLYGTYGILSLSSIDMTIRHPNNGEISVTWKWSQIEYAKLVIPSHHEKDTEKILVLRLVSDCGSANEDLDVQLYCESAIDLQLAISRYRSARQHSDCGSSNEDLDVQLYCESAIDLQLAISRYRSARQHRLMTSPLPLPPTPVSRLSSRLHSARRLSRSEGDLRWPLQVHNIRSRSGSRDGNSTKCIPQDQVAEPSPLGKIAKTLISASLGLMLSTPGCSEPDTSHDYQNFSFEDLQYVEYHNIDSETDDLPDLRISFQKSFSNRRESGSSIASGIYDEIVEQPAESHQFASRSQHESNIIANDGEFSPPPLPPRKSDFCNKILHRKIRNAEERESSRIPRKAQNVVDCQPSRAFSEPDYLPMSPGTFKPNSEDAYVVMGNLTTHKKIIAAEQLPM